MLVNNPVVLRISQSQFMGLRQNVTEKIKDLNIPQKPKRPLTGYFKYIQERRADLIREHPEWKVTDIAKKCASDWNNMDTDTKLKYQTQYKKEMEEYGKKCVEYGKSLTVEQKEGLKMYKTAVKKDKVTREKRKKSRDNLKPKRSPGPYLLYVMEQVRITNKPFIQVLKDLKGVWAQLPESDKATYIQKAAKAKEAYDKELEAWEKKMIESGNTDIVRVSTLKPLHPKTSGDQSKKNE